MRLEITVHLSREDHRVLDRIADAEERTAVATENAAASLASIDRYFQRLNRATTATITVGEITEQKE